MKKIKILLTIAIFVVLLANDSNGVSAMEISSQCGILMEQSTGRVLYEKNGYIKRGYADWRKGRFWLMEKKL